MKCKDINVILACQRDGGIGLGGKIPWISRYDLAQFKRLTTTTSSDGVKNAVVMGRKTFDSITCRLVGRKSFVVTRNHLQRIPDADVSYHSNLGDALHAAERDAEIEKIFVIGGGEIYTEVFAEWRRHIAVTYLTVLDTGYPCDTHINLEEICSIHYPAEPIKTVMDIGIKLELYELHPYNTGEDEYLNLLRRILKDGDIRENRTGIDTLSLFGERMTFDISERIPFLTTKRLAWKTLLRELLWFISGDTNNETLRAKGVRIWDGNSTREYLDSVGLTENAEGDLGAVYGHQWRHFGSEYVDCKTDYTGKGVDQLREVVRQIREEPNSRRIIMSAWNPAALKDMALPPCHLLAQWYVRSGDYLDCQMYQRSCDVALGVPFNIASYSILTYMLAHITGKRPGRFTHVLGDAHIYTDHINGVHSQLERTPYIFPRMSFSREIKDIDDFVESDFIIEGYLYHPTIKMKMAV
jgi:dihydrofolate reductase/thymidylate synthase